MALSPAAAKASALLKSGLSLTQIYSEYVEVSEELVREKEETARLGDLLEHINQELEEKTPALQQVGGREGGLERGGGGGERGLKAVRGELGEGGGLKPVGERK